MRLRRKSPARFLSTRAILVAGCFLLLAACAQTRYYPYVGANEQHGKGIAAKRVIDGIDVWSDGIPPRKYEIIGLVDDSRNGFFRDSILKDVTRKAKRMGGEGIIEYQAYTGVASAALAATGGASGNLGASAPVGSGAAAGAAYGGAATGGLSAAGSGQSRWWVIRYLPAGSKKKGNQAG
ncbi:hypothetical protein [Methylacidimicrobium tartarophylax]|uniref:Uncharacterized protein n=1 Tax=Methylacidimicrobium tartarophylax TaxID=1041768 RepID=A0A5E6M9C9_9BACT|nr:hypothetical protein [Methylacidimicrobium tartarophylax]VVM05808.1 hypothetical protein MAMT_00809 [Methylacidimicrobium tartarophylax]